MGAQFNIKDEETIRLARELAEQLGQSVTETFRQSILEKAERTPARRRKATVEEILAIADRAKGHWKPEFDDMELSTRHGELLYNEDGSFK